jgi:hypothetical protein
MSEPDPRVAQPTRDPAATLLRGGAVPALVTGAAVSAGCLAAGPSAAASAALGGLLAAIALAVGPVLMRLGRGYSPVGLMALAVAGYGGVVLGLATAFLLVKDASWLAGGYTAVGILAVVGAWIAGQARSTSRLRVMAFGAVDQPGQRSG